MFHINVMLQKATSFVSVLSKLVDFVTFCKFVFNCVRRFLNNYNHHNRIMTLVLAVAFHPHVKNKFLTWVKWLEGSRTTLTLRLRGLHLHNTIVIYHIIEKILSKSLYTIILIQMHQCISCSIHLFGLVSIRALLFL